MLISRCRYRFQSSLYSLHYNFQNLVLYSTKSPNQLNNSSPNQSNSSFPNLQIYADYFVNSLGFSPQQARSTSTRLGFKYTNYFKFCDNVNSVVDFLKQHDFDDTHIIKIVYTYPPILKISKETIDSKCQLLKSFGWTEYDVSELMRKVPFAFGISEENMSKKLGFLMTELGYKPGFLITHAVLLDLSLEKRLAPRHRVLSILKEKGLVHCSFYTMAIKTEKQILQMLERFKEDVPGLLELYESSKGCSHIDTISN